MLSSSGHLQGDRSSVVVSMQGKGLHVLSNVRSFDKKAKNSAAERSLDFDVSVKYWCGMTIGKL
jgi:hypothetical protein